jgi:hypothetical protein
MSLPSYVPSTEINSFCSSKSLAHISYFIHHIVAWKFSGSHSVSLRALRRDSLVVVGLPLHCLQHGSRATCARRPNSVLLVLPSIVIWRFGHSAVPPRRGENDCTNGYIIIIIIIIIIPAAQVKR